MKQEEGRALSVAKTKKKKVDEPIIINPQMKKPSVSDGDVNESLLSSFSRKNLSENLRSATIANAIRKASEDPESFLASYKAIDEAYK